MKKVLVFMFAALMLAGCTVSPAGTTAAPTAEPTAEAAETAVPDEPEETAAAGTEEETQMIEAVLEEELPQSLNVMIQDMPAVFTKDLNYTCEDKLKAGDEVILYFTGSFEEGRLTVIRAEKK
ncbi:MAG: hypothetical protein IIY72_06625 [Solobacterium sp.]|nr:hypothetical protein [Solobacterium sp.]MBQ1356139.1 hypothetical protein [Solobacterium sp.]